MALVDDHARQPAPPVQLLELGTVQCTFSVRSVCVQCGGVRVLSGFSLSLRFPSCVRWSSFSLSKLGVKSSLVVWLTLENIRLLFMIFSGVRYKRVTGAVVLCGIAVSVSITIRSSALSVPPCSAAALMPRSRSCITCMRIMGCVVAKRSKGAGRNEG